MKLERVYWIVGVGLTVTAFIVAAVVFAMLPECVPIHWNIRGEIDRFGPRATIFLMPGVMAFILLVFALLPRLSPRGFSDATFRSTSLFIMMVTEAFLLSLHALILGATLHRKQGFGPGILVGIFIFLAVLGPLMVRVRRNYFIGIRTPWTLASERVWEDTHRLAAWTMVASSVLGIVLIAAGTIAGAVLALIAGLATPVAYSFVHYKRLERAGRL